MSSRRNMLKMTLATTAGSLLVNPLSAKRSVKVADRKLKVLVAGAHPDDPETGAGGTVCKFTEAGHDVVVLYLTRGEAGIAGVSHKAAAQIRTAEANKACAVMKTRSIFFGQIDGDTAITPEWYTKMNTILADEKPDVILTHWPIDTHRDHRICSSLVYDAWLHCEKKAALYYFEVCTGAQTQNFSPTHFVDISTVIQKKWDACFLHESQKIKESYHADHAKMELFRGIERNTSYAEAFVHQWLSPDGFLP
jgi:LmbE family N-acetylglucosaminyl deacetylase